MRGTHLLANPWQGARVVGPLTAGTELLIRLTPAGGSCSNEVPPQGMRGYFWHAAVLATGAGWGYICVAFPESTDENAQRPLPAGWMRRIYQGNGAATLRYQNGQILPGAEVLLRATGNNNPDEFFVMSADGLSWGFGRFRTSALQSDERPESLPHERVLERAAELPPGWERIVLGAETLLYEAPGSNSRVVGTLPAGTVMLIRNHWRCWHGAVTERGDAWGSICTTIPPRDPVRMAFGHWTYERMPSGRCALIRSLPGEIVLYILADGSGWGKTSRALL